MLRIALAVLVVIGCSKAKEKEPSPPPAPPPPVAADAAPPIDAAPVADAGAEVDAAAGSAASASDFDFDKLSHEDKIKFMKQKVVPTMKPLFQKFDPKDFAKFGCKTCHGKDPQKAKYKMPTPDLPPLDFAAIKAGKEDPKAVEFMSKTVKPEMAKLLNQPEMSQTSPQGFGCLDCHTEKKKK